MNPEHLKAKLDEMQSEAVAALRTAPRSEDAIQIKNRYLGRKGQMQEVMQLLRDLDPDGKRDVGQASNRAKDLIEAAYEAGVAEPADRKGGG